MIKIFLKKIPDEIKGKIFCKKRIEEINSCNNEKVKLQKFYAWRLLEYAARELGFKPELLQFNRSKNGKWSCDAFKFSISHSGGYVAVAINDGEIGIDLQADASVDCKNFARKILTAKEYGVFSDLKDSHREFLLEKWTQKESIFKMLDTPLPISQIQTDCYPTATKKLTLGNEIFYLSCTATDFTVETVGA